MLILTYLSVLSKINSKMSNPKKEFSKIYDKYIDKIYRFIFIKVNLKEIAEDLTSETFLRCWDSFKESATEIENIQAFLYRIARNLVTDYYRQKGRTQFVSLENVSITDPSPTLEQKAVKDSDLLNIKLAISKLNDDYQEVLVWHYVDDLPVPEIAKILDKSEGAVRVMIHRALEALKGEVKEA